jgi:hypothetical protein
LKSEADIYDLIVVYIMVFPYGRDSTATENTRLIKGEDKIHYDDDSPFDDTTKEPNSPTPINKPAASVGIGFLGSLAVAVNNITGPGMLDLPSTFQRSGE